jgi:hypothetical protein
MTSDQFKKAANLALNQVDEDLSNENIGHFDGFGLPDFGMTMCTIRELARLIRWQCLHIYGDGHDSEALNEIAVLGKRRFSVIREN